jgi:CubicO group peptidase (beta-lactamase class C family)
MHSLLVARNGYLVAEHYYNGHGKHTIWHTRSVTKSVISALVGIALDKGYLDSVDQRIAELLPDYFYPGMDSAKYDITVKHLLTMTAGFEWEENGTIQDQWAASSDWLAFTVNLPMAYEPGTVFQYNSSLPHLLSGIITEQARMSTLDFANKFLFDSLGVTIMRWDGAPEGIFMGGFGLLLTPRDMARFGQLYVDGGIIDGFRILSPEWVEESTSKHVSTGSSVATGYGYLWWRKILQFFFGDTNMQLLDGLVEEYILPAVRH